MKAKTTPGSPRRARARRGEGEKLRDQILAAAERLLVETGDEDAVSIRAVSEAVGVTPPSIYLHFADKNELIFAICDKYFDELDRLAMEAARGSDDPVESLMLRGRAYIRFGVDNPEPYRVLFMRKPGATPQPFQHERILQSSAFAHLLQAVDEAVASGRLQGEPMLVAIHLWTVVHGITSLLISKPDFPWPDVDRVIGHGVRAGIFGVAARD